ncbi:hypothetical protein A33Q_4662 [Indibacter alkaliphilus LW1]|uniref:Uncharacterized protein n=1 Tax=Indibacter alkaliphilus (strain CCUG 57479 / KCTC 22604 / LW1) TaxID=1189612 RepID=S2CYF0_INDAL|nr:hypothetical protein [Indibacter alkaliphilus]EOZ91594.1 hypothetical protein A33Q_4662 [Indibacter alkaliphilus LW1]
MLKHRSKNPNNDDEIKFGFQLLIIIGLLKTFSLGYFQMQSKEMTMFWESSIPMQELDFIRYLFRFSGLVI